MKRIYSVMIKGRTLESKDLKELLARAVIAKRNSDPKYVFRVPFDGQSAAESSTRLYVATEV